MGVVSIVITAFSVILFGIIGLRSSGARVGQASNEWSPHAGIKVDPDQPLINWLLTSYVWTFGPP
jgi:hypothetical protein